MRRRGRWLLVTVVALALPLSADAAETLIRARRVFDGTRVREGEAVLVRDGRVAALGVLPESLGATVIDLGQRTLAPGFVDAHTHLALHPGGYEDQILKESPEFRAIAATRSAKATLEAGVTTVRDLGNEGAGFADVALRDAIRKGLVPGPRVLAAIQPVVATGSYGLVGYSPYLRTPPIAYEADGPSDVRRQVRTLLKQGADVIKVYVESYEKKTTRSDILSGARTWSTEELAALVDEAHAGGVKVAAHVYSDGGARQGVAAGVDSIEHGLYVEAESFAAMARKGIVYVPTLLVYEYWRDAKIFGAITPENHAKLRKTVELHAAAFRAALGSGVKIAFGSDSFELPGTNAQELVVMAREGMRPLEVLRSATAVAAELLGIRGDAGALEVGMPADLVAMDGDPIADITAVGRIVFVMQGGQIVVDKR